MDLVLYFPRTKLSALSRINFYFKKLPIKKSKKTIGDKKHNERSNLFSQLSIISTKRNDNLVLFLLKIQLSALSHIDFYFKKLPIEKKAKAH